MRYVLGIMFILAMAFVSTGCAQQNKPNPCFVSLNDFVSLEDLRSWKKFSPSAKSVGYYDPDAMEKAKKLYKEQQEMAAKQKAIQSLKPLKLSVPVVVMFEKSCLWANDGHMLAWALAEIPENDDVKLIVKEENTASATEDMKQNGYTLLMDEVYMTTENQMVLRRLTFQKVKTTK